MFRHPKYYKELKEFGKRGDRGKPTAASPDTDQAISSGSEGPKLQATSNKPQAPSSEKKRPQASSPKQQASSSKPQATSSEI